MKLSDRYTVEDGSVFLSGLQALVRLPVEMARFDRHQGRSTAAMVSGYEGSPLAGYDLELMRQQKLLAEHGVEFRPGLNEELAANIVQGSQLASASEDKTVDGIVGYWYGKAPGLDRATDALRHANLGGAAPTGGAVAIVGDDSIAKSSTVPCSSEMAIAELGMPVLVPSDPGECLTLGMHAVLLSRASGLWTGLKIATNVADGTATTRVTSDFAPVIPDNTITGRPFVHQVSARFLQPTLAELEHSLVNQRTEMARRYIAANDLNPVHGATGPDAVVGIVAAGQTYLDLRQALAGLGLTDEDLEAKGIRLLKLGAIFPLVPEQIKQFADGLAEIVVVEEKRSFIETGIKEILYGQLEAPCVTGKRTLKGAPVFRADADLTPEIIADVLRVRLVDHLELPEVEVELTAAPRRRPRIALPLLSTSRTPYFCSGCPHNRSTQVPDGSLVGAGIGCSGMVAMMPAERVGEVIGMTQMGGEGMTWVGMSPFVKAEHLFQNMGDGTFHHSGSLAIRAAVAGGANITYKLLYNSAVAMTGGQEAVGLRSIDEIVRELLAEGVAKIVITTEEPKRYRRRRLPKGVDVRHRDELISTQEELSKVAGVTVLINDQECATELRRKRKRNLAPKPSQRAFINQRVCEGCGDCGDKSNCLSVQPVPTELGRKTKIHQASCNIDLSCLDGDCPSFLSVSTAGTKTKRQVAPLTDPSVLPDPTLSVPTDEFAMRITGIGGTGVVTVAQIVATAAQIDGRFVRGLDQTGLAQKGGAVVSDVKITERAEPRANKIASRQADLYLGCDVLVAAQENYLGVADEERTVAIVSTAEVPTGAMVTDTTVAFPQADSTIGRIQQVTRSQGSQFVDARALTLDLFDDDQFANVFLLGVAFQAGALPVSSTSIEEALQLNGVAVDLNIQAFRRGRQFVADQSALLGDLAAPEVEAPLATVSDEVRTLVGTTALPTGDPVTELVTERAADLEAYQNLAYARRYVDAVARVHAREQRTAAGSTALTEAVARHLHKVMAYKDEYEVARLSIDPALQASLEAEFGPDYKATFRLHPPILRALGMKRKIKLGAWFAVVFRLLYAMRGLRGTKIDPFGLGQVRRAERELREEYFGTVDQVLARLDEIGIEHAVKIAALPDLVRGYEHIKLRNIEVYHEALEAAWDETRELTAGGVA